jgi:predicted permease
LINTLGDWAGPVAIQFDLYACTPLLLTLGILLAARYGGQQQRPNPLALLIRVPPLWAALIATVLNLLCVPPLSAITGLLDMMSGAVVPIMLFAIGLALKQGFYERRHYAVIIPVIFIQLLLMPLAAFGSAELLHLDHSLRTAVVLEAAMPSMALGVVLCDRYGLNSGIYAAAATTTTLLSIFTLPLWFSLVSSMA